MVFPIFKRVFPWAATTTWKRIVFFVAVLTTLLVVCLWPKHHRYLFAVVHREPLKVPIDRNDLLCIAAVTLMSFIVLRRSVRANVAAIERHLLDEATFVETEEFAFVARKLHERCCQKVDPYLLSNACTQLKNGESLNMIIM